MAVPVLLLLLAAASFAAPAPADVCVDSAPLLAPLLKDPRLAAAVAAHPGASLRGDEAGPPEARERPGGGKRLVYDLPLRGPGGPELASAGVTCDYDGDGHFLGAYLLTVQPPPAFHAEGEVARGEAFEAPIDSTRTFRLAPFSEGWIIEVKGANGDFCDMLTPPYHGPNDLVIFAWHFRNADNTGPNELGPKNVNAPGAVRVFRCAKTEAERAAAEASLRKVLWKSNASPKEVDEAVDTHERLSATAQRGTLAIRAMTLGNLGEGKRPWIESMRFRFELRDRAPGEQ